jgi:hypothetical protein
MKLLLEPKRFSPVSTWEILVLCRKGRLTLNKVYGLTLVTADGNFARSKDVSVLMNRWRHPDNSR